MTGVALPAPLPGSNICRFCGEGLQHVFVDLGMQPLANTYLSAADLRRMEPFYPLRLFVCARCFLVQLEECVSPRRMFGHYPYFSSYSETWLAHARAYAEMAADRFGLDARSLVMEIGSNDGYLLQYFAERGIPVLGVDPAANVATVAIARGIRTAVKFFGRNTAGELAAGGQHADLVVGNNVLAHVPDLNDFVSGLKIVLKPQGVITMEFPHVLRLMGENQFDTIYHEHVFYFSLTTVRRVFEAHGLTLFDVEELPTHGGSLRIYACHTGDASRPPGRHVDELAARETAAGLRSLDAYRCFGERVRQTKSALLEFLIAAKRGGKRIAGYGAPAKGNILLNYCGVRSDFIDCTVDVSPHKQGRFLPGTHIPVYQPDSIKTIRPDYLLILPWNLRDEIMAQMAYIREWGGQFVTPIPEVAVLP